jgi:hypothetical protein
VSTKHTPGGTADITAEYRSISANPSFRQKGESGSFDVIAIPDFAIVPNFLTIGVDKAGALNVKYARLKII